MNKSTILGNITRDPEIRYAQSGTAVASFGVAHNHRWKDAQGQAKEDVTFVDVTAFGKQAELIAQYFKKGSRILLSGRLKLDQWDDKQSGQKRSKLVIVLEEFHFIDRATEGGERQTETRATRTTATRESSAGPTAVEEEDNIPF